MATRARRYFSLARDELLDQGGSRTSKEYYLITLWYYRARLLECIPGTSQVFSGLKLQEFLTASGYTMEQFRSYPGLSVVTEEEWAAIEKGGYWGDYINQNCTVYCTNGELLLNN